MSDFDPAEQIVTAKQLAHAFDETPAQIVALTRLGILRPVHLRALPPGNRRFAGMPNDTQLRIEQPLFLKLLDCGPYDMHAHGPLVLAVRQIAGSTVEVT